MNGQLELTLAQKRNQRINNRRGNRQRPAGWWFQKMREVVDSAMTWEPAPQSTPEQMIFTSMHRAPATA